MSAANLATTVIFSGLAVLAGAALLYTWITVERRDEPGHLLGVPMMSTIAGVGVFSVVMVITSLATLPAWLRVLLAVVIGAIAGVASRNLWHDQNMLLINARKAVSDQPTNGGPDRS